MKLYRVVAYDNAHSYFHFGSKKEATAYAKKLRHEYKDTEWECATVEIETIAVKPTRAGIAEVLQDFVEYTCINEH